MCRRRTLHSCLPVDVPSACVNAGSRVIGVRNSGVCNCTFIYRDKKCLDKDREKHLDLHLVTHLGLDEDGDDFFDLTTLDDQRSKSESHADKNESISWALVRLA